MYTEPILTPAALAELRDLLHALEEDEEDTLSWNALADWAEKHRRPEMGRRARDGQPDVGAIVHAFALLAPTPQGRSACENVQWYADYAEPGYTAGERGICLGNWNATHAHVPGQGYTGEEDHSPERLGKLLGRLGVECEWEDEWSACDGCNALVRTEPDSYDWTPSYRIIGHSTMLCLECAAEQPDEEAPDTDPTPNSMAF